MSSCINRCCVYCNTIKNVEGVNVPYALLLFHLLSLSGQNHLKLDEVTECFLTTEGVKYQCKLQEFLQQLSFPQQRNAFNPLLMLCAVHLLVTRMPRLETTLKYSSLSKEVPTQCESQAVYLLCGLLCID